MGLNCISFYFQDGVQNLINFLANAKNHTVFQHYFIYSKVNVLSKEHMNYCTPGK